METQCRPPGIKTIFILFLKRKIMKTLFLVSILFLCAIQVLQAQPDPVTVKAYSTWVIPVKRGPAIRGLLYEVKDSSVVISNSTQKSDYISGKFASEEVRVKDIKAVHLRKKGAQGTAILIGGISGALIGILVGATSTSHGGPEQLEKDFNVGKMIVFPLLCTGIGIGIGGMLGGIKKQLPVHGDQARFNLSKKEMEERSIKNYLAGVQLPEVTFSILKETVADADGNVYHLLALGGQVWMAENLKVKHYRDGSEIPGATRDTNGTTYSWLAVNDTSRLCPAGWHVPGLAEWTSLYNSLGGELWAGKKLEEGFSNGSRTDQWWSSTETDAGNAKSFYLNNAKFGVMITIMAKTTGLSVRCIRDE
jgi:hypothetical protein